MWDTALKLTLAVFMLGNLLDMGLRLDLKAALAGLQRLRFVAAMLAWGFVLLPALAWGLAHLLPLSAAHATGLVLLGMAPTAPFLPPMVDRARGNLDLAAVAMLLTSLVVIGYLPLVAPFLTDGLQASPLTIARPLVLFLLLPLAVGVALRKLSQPLADRLHPVVKAVTGIDTLAMLALCLVVYGPGFLSLAGSWAIGAQLVFFATAVVAPFWLAPGLDRDDRVVLSLAMSTRNLGAAFAPLFSVHPAPEQAIVTVALGVLMQAAFSFAAATLFARSAVAPSRRV